MGRTVLVADDNLTIQRMAIEILSSEGIEVVTVANGVAAIKKLPAVNPSVVLADADMPGKDGYEVCEFIKASPEFADVAVLLVVGDADPYDEARGANARIDGVVKKPFDRDHLITVVAGHLARAESNRPVPIEPIPSPAVAEDVPAIASSNPAELSAPESLPPAFKRAEAGSDEEQRAAPGGEVMPPENIFLNEAAAEPPAIVSAPETAPVRGRETIADGCHSERSEESPYSKTSKYRDSSSPSAPQNDGTVDEPPATEMRETPGVVFFEPIGEQPEEPVQSDNTDQLSLQSDAFSEKFFEPVSTESSLPKAASETPAGQRPAEAAFFEDVEISHAEFEEMFERPVVEAAAAAAVGCESVEAEARSPGGMASGEPMGSAPLDSFRTGQSEVFSAESPGDERSGAPAQPEDLSANLAAPAYEPQAPSDLVRGELPSNEEHPPQPELDSGFIGRIVAAVVARMSPPALPAEAVRALEQAITEDVLLEFRKNPPDPEAASLPLPDEVRGRDPIADAPAEMRMRPVQ